MVVKLKLASLLVLPPPFQSPSPLELIQNQSFLPHVRNHNVVIKSKLTFHLRIVQVMKIIVLGLMISSILLMKALKLDRDSVFLSVSLMIL